ncbi:MAG: gamma carbonic anhydrase family protein [Myxococcota bacterium]|nr:gamma carbonic anhydrase family protein [Myxococcota bacterium]
MTTPDSDSEAVPAHQPLVLPYRGARPRIAATAWLAPTAVVIGDVEIGADTSVWFGTVVRGDVHRIRIGSRSNLQDHCVVHVTRDLHATEIGDEVTVGHRATVHGCRVRDGALVGIGAVVLDGADVGEEALVAAGALVAPGTKVPPRALVRGIPARVARTLDAEEVDRQRRRTLDYVETARAYASGAGR